MTALGAMDHAHLAGVVGVTKACGTVAKSLQWFSCGAASTPRGLCKRRRVYATVRSMILGYDIQTKVATPKYSQDQISK